MKTIERGFAIYDELKDAYGFSICVVQSSSVEPHVWIQNEVQVIDGEPYANAHLTPQQAIRVAQALMKFAAEATR